MGAGWEKNGDSTSPNAAGFSRLAEGDYHRRLAAAHGLAVVLFSAPHCGGCRTWKALLPEALDDFGARFFEVDVSEATGIARYFGIFHLPTIYLYRDGAFHAALQCETKRAALRDAVRTLLAAPPQDEPG